MAPILELHDVTTRFGGLPAVDGVSLDVEAGRILAVIGPNGAGKTTLLETVAGLHQPTSGRILLDGTDITARAPHTIRHQGVAEVRQTAHPLPSMTTRENVALGAMFGTPGGRRRERAALAAADDALDLVGLGDRASWPVERLDLHHRRSVDLARAIAGSPRLLLLDEVMAGLDPAELDASLTVVRRVRDDAGVTVVFVEHVMRAVTALAEEVAVLDVGRLLACGAPEAVMRDERVVEAYLGAGATPGA